MDEELYKIMQELKEAKSNKEDSEVLYLGTITLNEATPNRKCNNNKRCNCSN